MTAVMYKALIANGHLMAILWLLMAFHSRLMTVLAVILHLLTMQTVRTDNTDSLYGQYNHCLAVIMHSLLIEI